MNKIIYKRVEKERKRIASEFHDSIGQNLLFIKREINNLKEKPVLLKNEIRSIEKMINNCNEEFRAILYDLKPKAVYELGFAQALIVLSEDISKKFNIKCSVNISETDDKLSKDLEISLYRILQELINNSVKHSSANNIFIGYLNKPDLVSLVISDDGRGFNQMNMLNRGFIKNFGLKNIIEKVECYKGVIKISSSAGEGTLIRIEIPKEDYHYEYFSKQY